MSYFLSMSHLMAPSAPAWLEELCEKLRCNDLSLDTIDLTFPHMDDAEAKIFARALEGNNVVETLIVSCYAMMDDGPHAVASTLRTNTLLQRLQLKDMRNVREIATFFGNLENNESLVEVSLRHCTICAKAATAIACFLRKHTKVQEFRITDCSFTQDAFSVLCHEGFRRSSRSLRRLFLVNDELIGAASAALLVGMLRETSIRELVLSENDLGDNGTAILARGLIHRSSALELLNLRSNNVSADGALALQGLVTSSNQLVSLNVSNNELGDTGVAALARGLQSPSCTLKKLDLCLTGMETAGATAIATMLKVNKHLVELNLSFNGVRETGASELFKALKRNKTLKRLNLRRNRIGDTGAYLLAEELPFMAGLKELVLSKNDISSDGASALLHGLRSNVELEYLQVEERLAEAVTNELWQYIRLNKAGRRIFRSPNTIPDALWSKVYGRMNGDVETLYQFLTEKPDAIPSRGACFQPDCEEVLAANQRGKLHPQKDDV